MMINIRCVVCDNEIDIIYFDCVSRCYVAYCSVCKEEFGVDDDTAMKYYRDEE